MKTLTLLLCLFVTAELFGQIDVLPIYRLVEIDSLSKGGFVRSLKVRNDMVLVTIDSTPYAFVSSQSEKDVTPRFRASFDKKYNLEIRYWEIIKTDPESVTFKIAYSKFSKKYGSQKGKYYTIENLKIERGEIVGVYIADDKTTKIKFGIAGLSLFVLIGTLTLLVGEP